MTYLASYSIFHCDPTHPTYDLYRPLKTYSHNHIYKYLENSISYVLVFAATLYENFFHKKDFDFLTSSTFDLGSRSLKV